VTDTIPKADLRYYFDMALAYWRTPMGQEDPHVDCYIKILEAVRMELLDDDS
jgi:hypothetical protein